MNQIVTTAILLLATITYVASNSFTLQNSSMSPSYAKSRATEYKFVFRAPSPITQQFDLHITFPPTQYTNFSLETSNCSILTNGNEASGVTCLFHDDSGHVVFSSIPSVSMLNYTVTFWASTANYATTSTLTFQYYQPGQTALTSISNNLVQVITTKSLMTCSWSSASALESQIVGANTNYTAIF